MAVARYLADKSAIARWHHPQVRMVLAPLVEHGLIATCGITELEVLFSARGRADYQHVAQDRRAAYEWLPTEDNDLRRALSIQAELAGRGQLRAVSLPDLIIAAVAERHRICVLHYDGDYEHVASITGQATRWVVPQGSVT
ncbi:MAG: PIN domain nuclease [Actinomycetes bacterium]